MPLDKIALILVLGLAAMWCLAVLTGLIVIMPFGLVGLGIFAIVGYIVYRVIKDRLSNAEDDYYEKNVKQ